MVVAPYRSSARWQAQTERTPKVTNKVTTKEGEKRGGKWRDRKEAKTRKTRLTRKRGVEKVCMGLEGGCYRLCISAPERKRDV